MRTSRFKSSIRFRLISIYLLITIVAFVVVSLSISAIVEEFLVSERVKTTTTETERIALETAPIMLERSAQALYELASSRAQELGGRILILDRDAVVQMDSASELGGYQLSYQEIRDVIVDGADSSYGFHQITQPSTLGESNNISFVLQTTKTWVVYNVAPITVSGDTYGAIVYSSSIQDVMNSVTDIEQQTLIIFFIVCAIVALISMTLSSWLTKPITQLTQAIRRLGRRGYGERLDIRGGSEIEEVRDAFNRMSEKLENHDRLRDEFVSNASHELKTPMASMKILVESMLYQETLDTKVVREFLGDINNEIDRLNKIIADLLTLVHEDRQDNELKPQKIRYDLLVARAADRLKPISLGKNIAVQTNLYAMEIEGDPARLEQVVSNLIDNAIKYTDPGGKIFVELRQSGSEAVLSVRDTGIGIPEEDITHLFDRFYRVDKARSRGTGGTGLGLSIVDKIVQLHNGYIEVHSEEGVGSEFIVRLPIVQNHD